MTDAGFMLRAMSVLTVYILAIVNFAHADGLRRIVSDGETLVWPHARYTYYRLVVKDRSSTVDNLAFSEIALYDADGTRINKGLVQADATGIATTNLAAGTYAKYGYQTTSGMGDAAVSLFDGNTATGIDHWRPNSSIEANWIYFVMRLSEDVDVAPASYNIAFSSDVERAPKSWALQGSDDHATWFTLDERDATAVAAIAPAGEGWCNGGESISLNYESANIFVNRGGMLSVATPSRANSVHAYGGSVSIASDGRLGIDVASGRSDVFTGGGLVGTGTFEKTGSGALAISGVNSDFGGKVKSSGGTLAFRPAHITPKFTYYRFVVKDRSSAVANLAFSEIAFYDADGARINKGLVQADATGIATTNLAAGTYAKYGYQTTSGMGDAAVYLFDGNTATGIDHWRPNSSIEANWIYFVMRLSEDVDVAPASYNIAFSSDVERAPKSWALQGSDDHMTWFTLDERDATAVAAIAPAGAGWCNGGSSLPLVFYGDNAPVCDTGAKFFRFTIKAVGGSDGTRAISELALYDMQGKRLNVGLASMGRNYTVSSLPAGSFTWKYEWGGTYASDNQHEDKMFDENVETRLQGYSFGNAPDPAKPSTWMIWTMRLPDDATPVASYNFVPYRSPVAYPASCPVNWLVEASFDGTTWFEVDARSGEAASALLPSVEKKYCNNGHPIGFTSGCERHLAPTGAVVEVVNGATLELPATEVNAISGLAVDLTATAPLGTIANFNPASSGTLYLTSATAHPQLLDYAVPIVFADISNTVNISNWAVKVNGVAAPEDEYSLGFDENGVLRITRHGPGVMLIVY